MVAVYERPRISGRSGAKPKSPPRDVYEMTLNRVLSFAYGKPYGSEEPARKFQLGFTLHYPFDDDDPEDPIDGMELRLWATPKFRALEGKNVPTLYKYLQAFTNDSYQQPQGDFDGWDELERFAAQKAVSFELVEDDYNTPEDESVRATAWTANGTGTRFRVEVGPNAEGWARIMGDPMPMPVARARKTAKVEVLSVTKPDEGEVDNNF